MPELKNARHELFAQNVAKGMSQEAAYAAAGYDVKDPVSRAAKASRLVTNGIVAARIAELKKAGAEKALVEVADVVKGFLRIANADLADAYDENGKLKPIHQIPKELRLAISGIEVDEFLTGDKEGGVKVGYTKKIKLCDKKGSWDSLARYLKMFVDKVEHGVDENLASILEQTKWRPQKKE